MNKDELAILLKHFSKEGMFSRNIVKKMKNLGNLVSQSTALEIIEIKTNKKRQSKSKWQKNSVSKKAKKALSEEITKKVKKSNFKA